MKSKYVLLRRIYLVKVTGKKLVDDQAEDLATFYIRDPEPFTDTIDQDIEVIEMLENEAEITDKPEDL